MRKKILFYVLLLCFTSCEKHPWKEFKEFSSEDEVLAKIRIDDKPCFAPCTLTFINESENANNYMWHSEVGDSIIITDEFEPSIFFCDPGKYSVTLIAYNGTTASDTSNLNVDILQVRTFEKNIELGSRSCGIDVFPLRDTSYVIYSKYSATNFIKLNSVGKLIDEYAHNSDSNFEYSYGRPAITNEEEILFGGSKSIGSLQNQDFQNHAFIVKLNSFFASGGEVLIDNGNTKYEAVTSIAQTNSGNFILAGTYSVDFPFGGNSTFFASAIPDLSSIQIKEFVENSTPSINYKLFPTSFGQVIYILDNNGESNLVGITVWPQISWEYPLTGFEVSCGPIESSFGNYVIAGSKDDEIRIAEVSVLDEKIVQEKKITERVFAPFSISKLKDDGFILTGVVVDGMNGSLDLHLVKVNHNLDLVWEKSYGGNLDEKGWDAKETLDGGIIVVGETKSFDNPSGDLYVLKTDSKGRIY